MEDRNRFVSIAVKQEYATLCLKLFYKLLCNTL